MSIDEDVPSEASFVAFVDQQTAKIRQLHHKIHSSVLWLTLTCLTLLADIVSLAVRAADNTLDGLWVAVFATVMLLLTISFVNNLLRLIFNITEMKLLVYELRTTKSSA